jgi:plasmid stabilization system protein ParE
MKLIYTEQALFSLEEALSLIAPKVTPEKLMEIRDSILDTVDTLLLHPLQGQKEPYLENLG